LPISIGISCLKQFVIGLSRPIGGPLTASGVSPAKGRNMRQPVQCPHGAARSVFRHCARPREGRCDRGELERPAASAGHASHPEQTKQGPLALWERPTTLCGGLGPRLSPCRRSPAKAAVRGKEWGKRPADQPRDRGFLRLVVGRHIRHALGAWTHGRKSRTLHNLGRSRSSRAGHRLERGMPGHRASRSVGRTGLIWRRGTAVALRAGAGRGDSLRAAGWRPNSEPPNPPYATP